MVDALAAIKADKREKREVNDLVKFAENWVSFFEDKLASEIENNGGNFSPKSEEEVKKLVIARDYCYELAEFFDEHIPANTEVSE
jgi:hypothetical protein